MLLRVEDRIKLNRDAFMNESNQFRLNELNEIDFEKEYKIYELYDGVSVNSVNTNLVDNFIFWVNGIDMELGEEHLLED